MVPVLRVVSLGEALTSDKPDVAAGTHEPIEAADSVPDAAPGERIVAVGNPDIDPRASLTAADASPDEEKLSDEQLWRQAKEGNARNSARVAEGLGPEVWQALQEDGFRSRRPDRAG